MYKNQKISLCLPCRNETKTLAQIISCVPTCVDEIIVVSNASTDDSAAVARHAGAQVIEDNRTVGGIGYGFAHMSGMAVATGDIIIGADCDGTYPLEQIETIVDVFLRRDLTFLSCNRYPLQAGTHIPLILRLGVRLLNIEVRLLYGARINDILSGMWLFSREAISQLQLTEGGWNLSPQIKLNAITNPVIRFGEHSIIQHERCGKTKQVYVKTGFSHAFWILRNRFSYRQEWGISAVYAENSAQFTDLGVENEA